MLCYTHERAIARDNVKHRSEAIRAGIVATVNAVGQPR